MKIRKLFTLFSLSILSIASTFAQPNWVATTPSIAKECALLIDVNYGIDRVGTVYIIVINYDYSPIPTSAQVKAAALAGPAGGRVATAVLPVTVGNINTILTTALDFGSTYAVLSVFAVAEDGSGNLQATPIKLLGTTTSCTKINVLTGFNQPIECINLTPVATFQVVLGDPDPCNNGIYKGTQWTLDWGDGNTANYTSTTDNDIPPLAMRTHTYSNVTSCNYVFSNGIKNPCGETRGVQYVAVVHGREISSDGDGNTAIVNNADGTSTINVCAGTQSIITLRDASTWNCQNPTVPGGLTAVPNSSTRNIEWQYGEDPTGAVFNTITGTVTIAGLGAAPDSSGRMAPSPYATGSLSQAITIPATCQAGQYFRVYLEYWNQECNWNGPNYVDNFININVIAAPAAPTVPSRTICFGDATTLTVTSTPAGTITWYADPGLTTVLASDPNPGPYTYTPTISSAGAYTYYVTDQSTTGLMCMSPATTVTLTVKETLPQPGAISGPTQVCYSSTGNVFSVAANPPTEPTGGATQYIWTVPAGWTITAGQGTKAITVTAGTTTGAQTISMTDQYITAPTCTSTAQTFATNLNPVATINSASTGYACSGSPYTYTATSATGGCTFAWTRAVVAGISNGAGSGATATISETLNNTTNGPVNVAYIITPTINGCSGTPFTLTVTVNPVAEVDQPTNYYFCKGNPGAVNFTTTNTGGTMTYSWTNTNTSIGLPATGTGNISFTATNGGTSPITGTIVVTPTYTNGTGCTGSAKTFTITINPLGQVTNPGNQYFCNAVASSVTFSTTNTGGITTYSWTNSNTSIGLAASGTGNISFTPTNATTAPITGTIVVTPSFANGGTSCTGSTASFTITINPTGQVTNPGNQTVCAGSTENVTFATTNTGGVTTYAWTNTNTNIGLAASGTGNLSFTATNATNTYITGTIAVTPTYTNGGTSCTGTAQNFSIIVNPTGEVNAVASQVVCNGGSTAAMTFTSTRTGGANSYAWTNSNTGIGLAASGTGNIASFSGTNAGTSPIAGTITVTPTYTYNAVGCAGTAIAPTITVNPTGEVDQPTDLYVCNTATGTKTFTTTNTVGVTTYTWTNTNTGIGLAASGSGNISFTATNAGTTPISGTITVTPTFTYSGQACTGPAKTFTIYVNPTGEVDQPASQTLCIGSTATVNFTTTNGGAGVSSYTWTNTNTGIGLAATGSGNISFTTTNAGTAPVTGTIVVTPTYTYGGTGCAGSTKSFTITVNPSGQVTNPGNQTVCNSTLTTVNFATTNTGGVTTYAWTNTNTGIGLAATGSGNISFTSTNATTGQITGTIVVTPTFTNGGQSCTGTTKTFTITVNPTAVINSSLALTTCSNAALGYNATSSTAGCTFAWTRAVVPGISNGAGAGGTSSINESLINTTGSDVVATYVITPTYSGCAGTQADLLVTVHPQFTLAQLNSSVSICNNTSTNFNIVMTGGTSPYTVNYTKNGVAQAALNGYVSGTNVSTGVLTTGSYVYALTSVTDAYGCPTQSLGTNITVTVGAALTAATLTGSGDACYGAASTLKSVITGGAPPYTLTISGFSGSPVGAYTSGSNIPLTPPALSVGAHLYTLTNVTDACTNSITPNANYTINIAAIPDISATVPASQSICSGSAATITLNTTVPLTIFNYTVASVPSSGYTWSSAPSAGTITDGGSGTDNLTQTLTHNYNAAVTVTYTITPTGPGATACVGLQITRAVTVNPMPAITNMTATICGGGTFTATPVNSTNGVVPAGTTYSWAAPAGAGFSGGAAGSGASITGTLTNTTNAAATATYTVTPTAGGCTGST
ncbi:MAG: PKD-like domain-containing protein, partial [Bacteroidales bacterium]